MRRAVILAYLMAAAACAAPKPGAPLAATPTPPPVSASPAPDPQIAPPTQERGTDRCGAADLQYLVGRPKTEIPIPVSPGARRVVCTTCPMTRDFREDRQTILFDAATGLVTAVACN